MPVSIPFGEYTFHVVSDPYRSLPKKERERILRDLIPVTKRAFGRQDAPKAAEVREHAYGKKVSTVVLVEKDGHYIGYYSTTFHRLWIPSRASKKTGTFRSAVYLAGSVLDPLEKRKNLFSGLQRLALILEGDKQRLLDFLREKQGKRRRLEGGIDYLVARTQSGRVAASLKKHALWPFQPGPLRPEHREDFNSFLASLSERLSPGKPFEPEHAITRGAYGKRLYGPGIDLFGKDPHIAGQMDKLDHDAGDAMWGIGRYPATSGRYALDMPSGGPLFHFLRRRFPAESEPYLDSERRWGMLSSIHEELAGRHGRQWVRV